MPQNKTLHAILIFLLLIMSLNSCQQQPVTNVKEYWDLPVEKRDSIDFSRQHHYTVNYNFLVTADSVTLDALPPNSVELAYQSSTPSKVYKDDKVVVAATTYVVNDTTKQKTFYIKIARDQDTMGWIEEESLLKNVVPCDPISQFVHAFSNNYLFGFIIFIVLAILFYIYRLKKHQHIPFVHFQDIDSLYPSMLCVTTAFAALIYGTMQTFATSVWEDFYYDPSLNPVGQHYLIGIFLIAVWVMLIFAIATIEEIHKQLSHEDMLVYLLGLGCTWVIIYLVFSQSVRFYVGYPLFFVYVGFAWWHYKSHHIAKYICGQCGKPLHELGKCPHCGAVNK